MPCRRLISFVFTASHGGKRNAHGIIATLPATQWLFRSNRAMGRKPKSTPGPERQKSPTFRFEAGVDIKSSSASFNWLTLRLCLGCYRRCDHWGVAAVFSIVSAADERFAAHFATMLHSAWSHHPTANFHLLDCGIAPETVINLETFAAAAGIRLNVIKVDV